MPRPKGSKNKLKTDPTVQIEQLTAAKLALAEEEAQTAGVIAEQKKKLRDIQKRIKGLDKELAKLEARKSEIELAAKSEEAKKELQGKIEELLKSGVSADEILSKLK